MTKRMFEARLYEDVSNRVGYSAKKGQTVIVQRSYPFNDRLWDIVDPDTGVHLCDGLRASWLELRDEVKR